MEKSGEKAEEGRKKEECITRKEKPSSFSILLMLLHWQKYRAKAMEGTRKGRTEQYQSVIEASKKNRRKKQGGNKGKEEDTKRNEHGGSKNRTKKRPEVDENK